MKFDDNSLYCVSTNHEGTRRSLYDLATWKNGLSFKKIDFSETGLPVIKIAELNNGISASTAFTQGTYSEELFLTKGDIVFSWSGNPQTSIDVFRYNLPDGWLNQHIFKVTANEYYVSKDYLYYVLKYLKPHFTQIATNKQTTGLGHVTIADIKRMSVVVPSHEVQSTIVDVLKPIDDKIQLNNEINENLQQQVSALFDSWFVAFDRSNGEFPANWTEGTLGDIATITSGKRPPMKQTTVTNGVQIPLVGAASVMGFTNAVLYNEPILVTGRVGTHGVVQRLQTPCWTSDNTLVIKSPFYEFTYQVLQRVDYVNMNRGSTQPLITQTDLKNVSVILPPKAVLLDFEELAGSVMAIYELNRMKNARLAVLRETLLPKLMSGELDVSDIDL